MEHIIPIDDKSRIRVEKDVYTLEYKKTGKNGDYWRQDGFFCSLESLFTDWIRNAPTRSSKPINDLRSLVDCIEGAEKYAATLFKGK